MGIHDGHRERLRSRFLEYGLDAFNEINALEMLLFYAIPRKDTNPIAHALLARFETLQGVFSAAEELKEVNGISDSSAALIKLIPSITRLAYTKERKKSIALKNSARAADYLIPRFMYEDREVVLLLSLDANKCVRSCNEMGIGVINAVDINVRKIAETAMKNKACSVILAHNHPDGNTDPSPQDIETTRRIREALCLIDIPLVDHLIVSEQKYSSLCDLGLL